MDPSKDSQQTVTTILRDNEAAPEDDFIAELGYEQKYRRVFKTLGNTAVALTFTSPTMALLVIGYYSITFGGYWGLTWGWIIPAVLFLPQALAVAELCSSMPHNGASYWWTAALAPSRVSRPLSFISGWTIFLADMSVVASFSYAVASSYSAIIPILHPAWEPTNAQKMAIAMAVIICWALMNIVQMEKLAIAFQGLAILVLCTAVAFIVGLPAAHAAQNRPFTSGRTAFTEYTNYSEWNHAVSVPMTFFPVAWVINGWQSPAAIVEETQDARIAAPKAIVTAYSATAIIGFLVCLVCALCTEDMTALATDPSGLPLFTLVLSNFGRNGGVAFLLIVMTCTAVSGSAVLLTLSSQLNAFARDGGLPFSQKFAYIHPRTNMPFAAIALLVSTSFLILIFSLSTIAGSIIYSLTVIALYMTMGLPIGLRLFAGKRFVQGPFNYGRFSWPIHAWALLTMAYMVVMESFPLSPQWTAATFNYNWCVALGAILLAAVLWFAHGRKNYHGVKLDALHSFQSHMHDGKTDSTVKATEEGSLASRSIVS